MSGFAQKVLANIQSALKTKWRISTKNLKKKFIFASDSKSHPQIGIITVKKCEVKILMLGHLLPWKEIIFKDVKVRRA